MHREYEAIHCSDGDIYTKLNKESSNDNTKRKRITEIIHSSTILINQYAIIIQRRIYFD